MDFTALALKLKGEVFIDTTVRNEQATDFGRMMTRVPAAVVRPLCTEDVAETVKFARENKIAIGSRASGHCQTGQGLVDGGIVLDMTSLCDIGPIDQNTDVVECGAGTIWRALVQKALGANKIPPVLTNNLNVAVGGTVSVAGIGVASFRYGAQSDNVTELEVVTGEGEVVRCSATENTDLFDHVRSGLGQCGVITRAKTKLRDCGTHIRTIHLLYDDLDTAMKDHATLINEDRVDDLESWCVPCLQGFKMMGGERAPFAEWFFPTHATTEFTKGNEPDNSKVLDGLSYYKKTHEQDMPLIEFVNRLEPLFTLWRRAGYWGNAHPWMEVILPWDKAAHYINNVLAQLPPSALGGGHVLLWPSSGTTSTAPLFKTPPGDLVMGWGLLPGVPHDLLDQALPKLEMLSQMSIAAGGKRYLSGYITFQGKQWADHYGDQWEPFKAAKKKYDPDGILNPGFIDFDA